MGLHKHKSSSGDKVPVLVDSLLDKYLSRRSCCPLLVCQQDWTKTTPLFSFNFVERFGHDPRNNVIHVGVELDMGRFEDFFSL